MCFFFVTPVTPCSLVDRRLFPSVFLPKGLLSCDTRHVQLCFYEFSVSSFMNDRTIISRLFGVIVDLPE